jgi:hypothetical protein
MAATSHHGFAKPHPDDGEFDPGADIAALADSADSGLVRVSSGTGPPPASGMRAGDVYVKLPPVAAASSDEPSPVVVPEVEV